MGRGTLRTARHPARVREESLVRERVERGVAPHPANALITKSGAFPDELPWFSAYEIERFIFTAPEGASRLEGARDAGDAQLSYWTKWIPSPARCWSISGSGG